MNPLNLSSINLVAPYTVWGAGEQYYYFKTGFGAIYKVGFMDDYAIWESGAYQFLIINENNTLSPNDPKLKSTIFGSPAKPCVWPIERPTRRVSFE